jgi:hypothetical protein
MEASRSVSSYKGIDDTKPLEQSFVKTIFDSDDATPVLTPIADPPELAGLVEAVLDLARQDQNFLPPLAAIRGRIPVNIDKALSPTFFSGSFLEMRLDPIARSPLFELIHDIFEMSDDRFLLAESAGLIVSCACASKHCVTSLVKLGFLDLLFSCIPRVFLLSFPPIIFEILTALTIIWKRLSSMDLSTTILTEQLDQLFFITNPLSREFLIPFVRFICCLLVCGSLDSTQTERLTFHLHVNLYRCLHIDPHSVDSESGEELGQLVEIALAMSRSECLHKRLVVSRSHPFVHISHSIHLLPPLVAARFLFFYDECRLFCGKRVMRELLVELNCETLVEFLDMGIPSLTEAALNVISLIIERDCIQAEIISDHIIPSIIEPLLESMVADQFRLKRAALRFVHAVVVRLDWSALPDEAFVRFIHTAPDCIYLSAEDTTESVSFLKSLLAALHTQIPEFFEFVIRICCELDIWSTVEELRGKDTVFDCLFAELDSIQNDSEPKRMVPFLT